MTARTHDLAAITALGIVVITHAVHQPITFSTLVVALLANQIGGIAPDIDQPTAPFWRNLPIGGYFGRVIDKMLGGHRFITHSSLGVALLAFLSSALLHFLHPIMTSVDTHIVWLAFMVGMVSHLAMDTLTKEGVPWLLPLPFKFGVPPLKALRITTGKFGEKCLFFGIAAVDVVYVWSNYPQLAELFHSHIIR